MRALIAAVALLLGSPQVQGECPLRFVEPRLQDLEAAATKLAPEALMPALAARDASVRDLALVARWFSIRANGDAEQHMRATLELLEIWDQHRPAGRLLRREREELAAQGWPMPSAAEIDRTLSRLGDRSAVLERTRALLAVPSPCLRQLRQAQRGVTVMALSHDPEALDVLGQVLIALGEHAAADQTVLYRAEAGAADALTQLAGAYRRSSPQGCAEAAALTELLFSPR